MRSQVASGRYGSVSEVVRAGLRILEEHEFKYRALQQAITGDMQSGVAEDIDMAAIRRELDRDWSYCAVPGFCGLIRVACWEGP